MSLELWGHYRNSRDGHFCAFWSLRLRSKTPLENIFAENEISGHVVVPFALNRKTARYRIFSSKFLTIELTKAICLHDNRLWFPVLKRGGTATYPLTGFAENVTVDRGNYVSETLEETWAFRIKAEFEGFDLYINDCVPPPVNLKKKTPLIIH